MGRRLTLEIQESEAELMVLLSQQKQGKLKERIQALYLLKSGQVEELKALARLLGRDTTTLYRWFERYREGGLARLLELDYRRGGRPSALPEQVRAALWKRLQEPTGFGSYKAIQQWLRDVYGLEVGYKTIHRIVRYQLKARPKATRTRGRKRSRSTSSACESAASVLI